LFFKFFSTIFSFFIYFCKLQDHMNVSVFHSSHCKGSFFFLLLAFIVIFWYEKSEKWLLMFFFKVCMHNLNFRIFFQTLCKPYFCLGFSFYLCKTLWKKESEMEKYHVKYSRMKQKLKQT
jgi:hypothetical protein